MKAKFKESDIIHKSYGFVFKKIRIETRTTHVRHFKTYSI